MTLTRSRFVLPAILAAAAAIVAAVLFALGQFVSPDVAPAVQQVREAAERRPVSGTDRIVWDYQEIVRNEPANLDAHAVLGWAYLQKARETGDPGYYSKTQAILDAALAKDPKHAESLAAKGALALARHDFAEALTLGEGAVALAPYVARYYGVVADAQIELGQYDAAVTTIQAMVDLRPDLASYSRVSYARELYGDLEGAIEAMDLAVRAGGPTAENTEWTRVQLGNLHFARGDLRAAEAQYRRSLTVLPGYVYAQAGLARVLAAEGATDEAVKLYEEAIARAPLPEFVIGLGETLEAAGRITEAERQYELVRAMQRLFASSGVAVDLELALFEADHGTDPAAAVTMAQAGYERRPGIKAADTLAWALYRTGRYDEARRLSDEALRLGTQDALMLYHAGMIAHAQGDAETARERLAQALALNPHFSPLHGPEARTTLEALR
jgi:tetratricopeptide (TPR) repeat protein